jgi:hypothetical protein
MDEPRVVWFCPTCRFEVLNDEPWIPAIEGEDLPGFGGAHDVVWDNPVRFHDGHFRETIGGKRYRREWSGARR